MKYIQKALCLLLSVLFTLSSPVDFSPKNTIIVSDLDDVLIQIDWIKVSRIVLQGLSFNPIESKNYLAALRRMAYRWQDKRGNWVLRDESGNKINGTVFQLLYHGMIDEEIRPYVSDILTVLNSSRSYIQGTKKILEYLKNIKGYTIIYATNKDRISYDQTAEYFEGEFTDLAHKVFVAQQENDDATIEQFKKLSKIADLPDSYKELLDKALTTQETEIIFHAPKSKPDVDYYNYVRRVVGPEKNILFIDDRKENIDGFNSLKNSMVALQGIHFRDPAQLAQQLVELNILSPDVDGALLDEIQYAGIIGKIRLFIKKLGKIFEDIWTFPILFAQ